MKERTRVDIVGVDVPFWDLMVLWVKVIVAAIPALLLLSGMGLLMFMLGMALIS